MTIPSFPGFPKPKKNYSKLPHVFVECLPQISSLAEMKVLLYVLRHTWGYSEFDTPKRITLDEFQNGRKRRNGKRMDSGIGMSSNAIKDGICRAIEQGFLIQFSDGRDKARSSHEYILNMRGSEVDTLPSEVDTRSEKETLERNLSKNPARAENTPSATAEQPPTAMETPNQDSSEEATPTATDELEGAEALDAFGLNDRTPDREPTTSDGDWTARQQKAQKDEPWLGWADGKLHPRSGIGVDKLECVGWLIERETGRVPIDGQWPGWGKACAAIYQAGEGDFPAILEGIRRAWAREEQYRPRHPMGHVNEVANVKAGKKTAKDKRYSEAWYERQMQEDPQRELNEIAYERTCQQ